MQTPPTPDDLVARNVAGLRSARGHTVRTLSTRLGELGHPILPSGITKVEQGQRRVDPGDLVALSLALGVNPNRLLLPDGGQVALTPTVDVSARDAWWWADGKAPLLEAPSDLDEKNPPVGELYDDFRRHARPTSERLREQHTAVQAARDVMARLHVLLAVRGDKSGTEPDEVSEDPTYSALLWKHSPSGTASMLRSALRRLVAEVEDLIGDDRGQRQ